MMSGDNSVSKIADLVMIYCRDRDGRIRAEDAISTAAAVAGEFCLAASGINPDEHDHVPGQPLISNDVNRILAGDSQDPKQFAPETAFGLLQAALPIMRMSPQDVPDLIGIFGNFAQAMGTMTQQSWGWVPLTVPQDNRPRVMPLRAAFELRGKVRELFHRQSTSEKDQALVCVGALAQILMLTRDTLSPTIAMPVAYETLVGMSKTFPMTAKHLKSAQN